MTPDEITEGMRHIALQVMKEKGITPRESLAEIIALAAGRAFTLGQVTAYSTVMGSLVLELAKKGVGQ
jgi:hypothetical protein